MYIMGNIQFEKEPPVLREEVAVAIKKNKNTTNRLLALLVEMVIATL